ncbi:PAS domain S-box protein [uncultured Flavobacterium sp.]|uniref:sensor histidine kinase n=1 Tax=uncultured Flavobacterium sp. TaxID=165435 RepID=UPI0030ECF07E|tara:strand:- start:132718 stop:135072 length:2355 start_codon:yes stop_codon:yes gene_type:complete
MFKNVYRLINWFFNKPKSVGFIVFFALSSLFIYIAYQNYQLNKENKRVEMSNTLNVITHNIEQSLKNCYTTTLTLALTINDEGIPQNFDSIGKKLLESNSSINAVQLVPNGIIKYIYPMQGNEAAMGLDILKSKELREESLKSIQNQKMYFAGPFELAQGGQGIVGRLPVYIKSKFWGFSAVVIKMDRLLLTSGISTLNTKNFYFQLSKVNPNTKKEDFFLPEYIKMTNNNHVSSYIPDGDWKFSIIDKNSKTLLNEFMFKILISLMVSYTLGLFTILLLKKPEELQLLIEEQANKLVTSEIKFKTIFDQAALGIANIDSTTGKFIEINENFCELLGYSESEMKNKDFQSITHPDDLDKDLEYIKNIERGVIEQYSMEKRYYTKQGKIIWVNLSVTPLFVNNNFKEYTFISIVEDITERKKNEQIIVNSQNRIESLINTIDGIVWECDANTFEFSFISKKVENILGYTSEEWLSSKTFWQDHIYHEDRDNIVDFCSKKVVESLDHDFEYRMVAKDGSIIWLRDIVNVVTKNNVAVSLRGIMIDVTKNKEIEKDLNTSFSLVTEQNERLLNFSYIVSHNLRSHTSNISSLIGLIEITDDIDEREEMIGLLKSVSNSLNETLMNLNEVVNIQTNKSLTTEKLNLSNYIASTLTVLSGQIKSNNVTINNLVSDEIEVNYNSAYLESILYNIISNGIRYRDKERSSIITINFYEENNLKVIEIADNGIGIDLEKYKNKIFGMYKTFSNSKDSRGIGLFITKNQIEAMGGSITVESELNLGTTFKIYIL